MKVLIRPEVYAQIDYYVQNTNIEISGVGRVKQRANGVMEVTKIYLIDQENTAATTDICPDALATLMYESRMDAEEFGDLNFWWHSHVNMGVFWSGTDMATIEQFGRHGYLLATVFNKKREFRSAYLAGSTGFLPEVFVDNIATQISYVASDDEVKSWANELKTKAKAKAKKFTQTKYNNNYWDHWDTQWGAKKAKKTKGKKGKKVKPKTMLSEDIYTDEDKASDDLNSFLTEAQVAEWNAFYGELKDVDLVNTTYCDLWEFYCLWEGDFKAMSDFVINQLSIREIEDGNTL